jgi:PhnB protein
VAQKKNDKKAAAAKAAKNAKPAKSGKGAAAAKPAKAAKNGKAAKPAKAGKPATAAKPAAKKSKKAEPIPKGFSTVSAHLVVAGAGKAIEFYGKALGAKLKGKPMLTPDGRVAHAELQIGDSRVMLCDDFPEWNGGVARAASALSATPVTLHLYVKNCDKVFEQAVAAGCQVVMPPMDAFWGDRYGKLRDPFGHEWSVATHTKDMTAKQMEKAMIAAMSAPECQPAPEAASGEASAQG